MRTKFLVNKMPRDRALPNFGEKSFDTRKDQEEFPPMRCPYRKPGLRGWVMDCDGNTVAFQLPAKPVVGDSLTSSARPEWRSPTQAGRRQPEICPSSYHSNIALPIMRTEQTFDTLGSTEMHPTDPTATQ